MLTNPGLFKDFSRYDICILFKQKLIVWQKLEKDNRERELKQKSQRLFFSLGQRVSLIRLGDCSRSSQMVLLSSPAETKTPSSFIYLLLTALCLSSWRTPKSTCAPPALSSSLRPSYNSSFIKKKPFTHSWWHQINLHPTSFYVHYLKPKLCVGLKRSGLFCNMLYFLNNFFNFF